MKLFLAYLRLIRPLNLLIILFTLYVVRFLFIFPLIGFKYASLSVNELTYALFSFSFVLVASAGYIVNDYYDIEIDRVNKPQRVIIGNTISSSQALRIYWLFNALAIMLGFWSSNKAGAYQFGFLFAFYVGALWLYSYRLKSTFLYGNILVALCLSLVPLAGIYIQSDASTLSLSITTIHYYAWGISVFAFLSSLVREIVKDMEDVEGDSVAGCKTMPIVIGRKKTKIVVQLLVGLMIIMIGAFQRFLYTGMAKPDIIYSAIFIQVPYLIVLWKIKKASSTRDYKRVSGWLKLIMVTGISYFFVFALEIWIIVQLVKSFTK